MSDTPIKYITEIIHFVEHSLSDKLHHDVDFLLVKKTDCTCGKFQFETSEPLVVMPYIHSGKLSFTGDKESCTSPTRTNFIYLPNGTYSIETENDHAEIYLLFIHQRFIQENMPILDTENGNKRKALTKKQLHVGEKDYLLLQEIAGSKFPKDLHKLIYKKKLFELLIDKLYQLEHSNKSTLKEIEVQRMGDVKNIIETRFTENLTISTLAREVGTNEQYLKQHFKQLYGKTVYHYLLSRRMTKARELLLTKKYKVSDVAELTGYKHATHFTTIFKKYFGHRPNEFK